MIARKLKVVGKVHAKLDPRDLDSLEIYFKRLEQRRREYGGAWVKYSFLITAFLAYAVAFLAN